VPRIGQESAYKSTETIADNYSLDETIEIVEKFGAKILD